MTFQWLKHSIDHKVQEAVWQYFLDHSQLQQNGYWKVFFFAKDEDDFWRRVEARYTGDYIRYTVEEKEATKKARGEREARDTEALAFGRIMMKNKAKISEFFYKGPWHKKVLAIAYLKIQRYLFTKRGLAN